MQQRGSISIPVPDIVVRKSPSFQGDDIPPKGDDLQKIKQAHPLVLTKRGSTGSIGLGARGPLKRSPLALEPLANGRPAVPSVKEQPEEMETDLETPAEADNEPTDRPIDKQSPASTNMGYAADEPGGAAAAPAEAGKGRGKKAFFRRPSLGLLPPTVTIEDSDTERDLSSDDASYRERPLDFRDVISSSEESLNTKGTKR